MSNRGDILLRIHFTCQDLENIQVARSPDPLWEIVCSICRLQDQDGRLAFGPWRREARVRLRRGGAPRRAATALRSVVPLATYIPDFLTPPLDGESIGLADGIDRVLMTPRRQLRHELVLLAASGGKPLAAAALARGDLDTLKLLGGSLYTYHEAFIMPAWERISAAVSADVAWRSRAVVTGGVRALLDTFRPMAAWLPPVLEVDYPVDQDLHLDGRGLLLVPSYFCCRRPITLVDATLRPVLVYPVDKTVLPAPDAAPSDLGKLLGPTRAALLYAAAARDCGTTSELAASVGISLPSTSQQLTVLREAGLLTSRRDGKRVLHSTTPLGCRLLGSHFG
jgi:DNA-binding transcriptional ArsR family regulator